MTIKSSSNNYRRCKQLLLSSPPINKITLLSNKTVVITVEVGEDPVVVLVVVLVVVSVAERDKESTVTRTETVLITVKIVFPPLKDTLLPLLIRISKAVRQRIALLDGSGQQV